MLFSRWMLHSSNVKRSNFSGKRHFGITQNCLKGVYCWCVLASMKNPCYFCGIYGHFGVPFGFFFSKVANLVKSVVLGMFVRGVLARKKNPCYFCDIWGHFEASLGFFFSKVVNLVKFIILALFATFVRGVLRTKHTLVTNWINNFYLN